jgi:hypothetical protein
VKFFVAFEPVLFTERMPSSSLFGTELDGFSFLLDYAFPSHEQGKVRDEPPVVPLLK